MKKFRIVAIVLGVIIALLVIGAILGSNWVNNNFEALINSKKDKKYEYFFDKADFSLMKRTISISNVKIVPVGKPNGTYIEGSVSKIYLENLALIRFFLYREVDISKLLFLEPSFVVKMPLESKKKEHAGEAIKGLFGDVLSRGVIKDFEIGKASAVVLRGEKKLGSFSNFNLIATDLETDSLRIQYPIPFDFGRITLSIDSIDYEMASGQRFKADLVSFDTQSEQFLMKKISMTYPEGIRKAAAKGKFQTDLIAFELDSLLFSGVEAKSNLYSDLDVRARKLEIFGLDLEDFRDKSLPRPEDQEKPLFQGMVKKITFPLKLDTLRITNSSISYGESVPANGGHWRFNLDHLNGQLVNITSIPEYQAKLGKFSGDFTGKIEGNGTMKIGLTVPYDKDEFDMAVSLTNFSMPRLNETLKPIMNGDIVTGELVNLNLKIHGNSKQTKNTLRFDYSNLKIELFKKGTREKNKIASSLANIAVNTNNLPGDKSYRTAAYTVAINPYRGPFFQIWQSTKEGMMMIVPAGAAKSILDSTESVSEKAKKKKKEKQEKEPKEPHHKKEKHKKEKN